MRLAAVLTLCSVAWAQKHENTGTPLRISANCSSEWVQAAGLNCTAEMPCPIYLELSDLELVGNRMLLTGNLHTGSATLESILLGSDDFGRTWTEAHARISAGVLDSIQFYDFEIGWISGHLLQDRLSRDAFFLLTNDGGKTWRKRTLFGESRIGAIEEFWFDSRAHGLMSFDRVRGAENGLRHEQYESSTGGESWSIRQVDSYPIPLKRPPRVEEDWRIRADTKTHRLERRQDGKWLPVASFLITAGECKPGEAAAPAEPAD
jgi:hypothetical protein